MPIYEYRCSACGFQDEFLQKVTEPLLSRCPSCGKETFQKLLSAAGFQLKGSGWYVTDFRNKGAKPASGGEPKAEGASDTKPDSAKESKGDAKAGTQSDANSVSKPDETPAAKPKAKTAASS